MNQDQQPQPWWKDKRLVWALAALAGLVIITILGYWLRWSGTGLETKSVWDWLDLLIVPLVIALATFWFNNQARKSERTLDEERASREALQQYLDRMQELIFDKDLKESWKEDSEVRREVRHVARARTLTVLKSLNGIQKGQMVMFLHEAGLIRKVREELEGRPEAIINLKDANLNNANLGDIVIADLSGAILSRACLKDANLSNANLNNADLSNAILEGAKLSDVNQAKLIGADLRSAILKGANLSSVCLKDANLSNANLSNAILARADLSDAKLGFADLRDTNLSYANLHYADLSYADLRRADLSNAEEWTNEQLAQAESLVGATRPDGTKMTERAWEDFKQRYR